MKSNKRTGVKQHKSNRSKFHTSYKKVEIIKQGEPGPSKYIVYKDGKVIDFISNSKKIHLADHLTDIAKKAIENNKATRIAKKERMKQILASITGFDPNIYYSRKEKKMFTRAIKKYLFVQPKLVNLTDEEIKVRFQLEKEYKAKLLANRPHINEIKASIQKKENLLKLLKDNKQILNDKENNRKFRYIIQNKSTDNSTKDIDFYTDYLYAKDKEEAFTKARPLAKKYENSDKFCGIRIEDLSNNNWTYYTKSKLLAA